jgi:ABC-type nickel/cobalt efflux system permease component RcnA
MLIRAKIVLMFCYVLSYRRSLRNQNQIQSQIVNQKSNQQEGSTKSSTKRSRRSKGASQWYGHPHDLVHDEISMAKACGEKHVTKKQQEQEKQTAAM